MKKLLSILLALVMVLTMVPAAAFAAQTVPQSGTLSGSMTNPLYAPEENALSGGMQPRKTYSALSGGIDASTRDSYGNEIAAQQLAEGMAARQDTIAVSVSMAVEDVTSVDDMNNYLTGLFLVAMAHNGNPTQGDYLLWHYAGMEFDGSYTGGSMYYYIDAVYYVDYYTTAAQEQALSAEVAQVIDGFGFTDTTDDYTKTKTVYDYICDNVTYDYDNLYDDSYTRKYSAYAAMMDGTAVCQGYATLLYRMLLELGVDCRVITGDSDGDAISDHAWNIAALEEQYYNLDATWDAGAGSYGFFLCSPDNFPGHDRDEEYDSAEFHAAYPMAAQDYVYLGPDVMAAGVCGDNLTWTLDKDGLLVVLGSGDMDDGAPWSAYRDKIYLVSLEEGVTSVGAGAFAGCPNLHSVTIPDSMAAIGDGAFEDCDALKWVTLPAGMNTLGEEAFRGCGALKNVTVHGGLESVGDHAFADCTALDTFTVLGDAAQLGAGMFSGCTALNILQFYGDAPALSDDCFSGVTAEATYPCSNDTWNGVAGGNYGGTITWYQRHDQSAPVETVEPTCTENGYTDYICELCGPYRGDIVPPLEHDYAAAITEPTCTEWGYTTYTCQRCSSSYEDDRVPPLGHRETTVGGMGASCTQPGLTDGVVCQRCDEVLVPQTGVEQLPHTPVVIPAVAATCTSTGLTEGSYCGGCGTVLVYQYETAALGHKPEAIPAVAPTCKTTGLTEGSACTVCSAVLVRQEIVEMLPHTEVIIPGKAATCTTTGLTEGSYCSVCGDVLVRQQTVACLPHTPKVIPEIPATCIQNGRSEGSLCDECGWVLVNPQPTPVAAHKVENGICTVCYKKVLTITAQPTDAVAAKGKKATVTVKAEGEGLKYAWYYSDDGGKTFKKTDSFKTNTYSLTMNESRSGRVVYCVVSDKYGNQVQSNKAALSLPEPPQIVVQPTYAYAKKGETATISFVAEGEGLTYTWYYAGAGSSSYKKTTSFTGPEYSVEMTDSRAGRKVYCVVTDKYGQSVKTKTCTLRMALEIVDDLDDAKAASGKKASATVKANGQGLTYAWYYSDDGGKTFKYTKSFKTATYSLSMNDSRDGRMVYCVVSDKYGNSAKTEVATLTMVPPPRIVVQPTYAYAKKGETATISFEAEGEGLTYTWYYAAAGSSSYKKTTSFTGPEYSVEMTDSRAGRKVYCVVTDKYGVSVKTKTCTLRMALEITDDIEDASAAKGKKASVTVKANGQGLKYEWFYSDDGGETFKYTKSFKTATYSLSMNEARNGRMVYCVITDKYGNTVQTDVATLTMK